MIFAMDYDLFDLPIRITMTHSNLGLKSNLMIDDGRKQRNYFPGDFAYQLDPSSFDSRLLGNNSQWSKKQIDEYHQTIFCLRCKRPCAGTCDRE